MKPEIRCEKCQKLYARRHDVQGKGVLEVLEEGMRIRPLDTPNEVGVLTCSCGHTTLFPMALLGMA